MEIQVGKEYKTRDGRKVIIYATDGSGEYPIHGALVVDDGNKYAYEWTLDGIYLIDNVDDKDIVSEWTEPIYFDWDCLPKWADRWIGMGKEGWWYCFENKPFIAGNYFWDNNSSIAQIPTSHIPKNYTGDWKESLHGNPKYK